MALEKYQSVDLSQLLTPSGQEGERPHNEAEDRLRVGIRQLVTGQLGAEGDSISFTRSALRKA